MFSVIAWESPEFTNYLLFWLSTSFLCWKHSNVLTLGLVCFSQNNFLSTTLHSCLRAFPTVLPSFSRYLYCSLFPFSSLNKCHLLGEAISNHPAKKHTKIIILSLLYFFIALTIIYCICLLIIKIVFIRNHKYKASCNVEIENNITNGSHTKS